MSPPKWQFCRGFNVLAVLMSPKITDDLAFRTKKIIIAVSLAVNKNIRIQIQNIY